MDEVKSTPSIVVTIPTLGNRLAGLERQLRSIVAQGLVAATEDRCGDQVFVVVDGAAPESRDLAHCCPVGKVMLDVAGDGGFDSGGVTWSHLHHEDHNWGNPQRNYVLDHLAKADLISWNDDDDVYNPGAFDAIRARALEHPGKVLLFRFTTVGREVLWAHRGLVKEARIGGHCIVTPNVPGRVGRWSRRYEADFDFIQSTLALTGGAENAAWCDEVIATARPDA